MSETQRVAVECPGCSPSDPTVHEVLKEGGHATVRCGECGHVHKTELVEEPTVSRRVIISQEDESFEAWAEAPPDEEVAVGEEFVVETDVAIFQVRITSLENVDGARVERTQAKDVKTFWTRAVDNVEVALTLHPKDGRRNETESLKLQVPGDEKFVVGETQSFGDYEFTVEGLHIRGDASGYHMNKLDHDGDMAFAKDLKRVYARNEKLDPWSPW
jgi:uncharacterized Zn finger protein